MTVQEAIALAFGQYQSGQRPQAEQTARQVLAAVPNQPDMLHLLGVLFLERGERDSALACFAEALKTQPNNPQLLNSTGVTLRELKRFDEADGAFRRAMQIDPNLDTAARNLATLLHQTGKFDDAIATYQSLVKTQPNQPDVLNSIGNAYAQSDRPESALPFYEKAIALRPDYAEAHLNFGNALTVMEKREQAEPYLRRAIALRPDYGEAHRALGNVLRGLDRIDEALAEQRRSVELTPQSPLAIRDLGNALLAAGQFEFATEQFKKVLAIDPQDAPASIAMGMTLLLHGDFENGLPLYEQRRRLPTLARFEQNFGKPQWDGGDLTGKRILIHAEQGFGDTIQFMRYIPQVARRGGSIYFACLPEMTRLLQQFKGIEKFLTSGDAVPDFDVHCSLATLPMIMKTTMSTIPADVPYLRADPELSARWRERIPKDGRTSVGLVWAGRPNPDPKRTIPFQFLAPLKECKNARFFSLQIGEPARAIANAEFEITDLSKDLTDLSETAAAMENLDLIITIDTATAHLAGALARPTWTLLPFLADWRWFLNRSDSPWYPTMQLFRQPTPGNWKTPIEQVIRALAQFGDA